MSEQDPDATADSKAADAAPKDVNPDDATTEIASAKASPSPRPRSATSRARRIGGAAAATRPDATDVKPGSKVDAKADAPTSMVKKPGAAKAGSSKTAAAASSAKATGKATGKAGKSARATDDDGAESSAAALTFSVPGWVRWAPGFVFAAVAVVFLSLFALSRIGGDDPPDSTSSSTRQEVLAAAKTCLATLNTYRYDQLAQAEAAGVRCTTGQITTAYKRTVSTILRKNAPPLKAVQLAKINTAGIEAVTKNGKQWTVLAYGQLNITTANSAKQGRIDPFAVVARLEQVKGKWVISKIDPVSSFSP